MKILLLTALFVFAFGFTFAQEKTETTKTEPKIHSSKKASKKVFPSAIQRKASPETKTSKESSKKENAELPYKSRKINNSERIEKRKREKEKNSNTKKTIKK